MLKRLFDDSKALFILIIAILSISCAYHYINYMQQTAAAKRDIAATKARFEEVEWTQIATAIRETKHLGQLQSEGSAVLLKDAIHKAYPDLSVLKEKFDLQEYNSTKMNSVLLDAVPKANFLGKFNDHNGIIVATDDKILYNLIVRPESIDGTWDTFISGNFNRSLAEHATSEIYKRSADFIFIEPHPLLMARKSHYMITYPSMEELRKVYDSEGLTGLREYIILAPVYITATGDIFDTPDYALSGLRTNNHKITVISCISLYDMLARYYITDLKALDKLKRDTLQDKEDALVDLYYSSIYTVIIHLLVITSILGIRECISRRTSTN